ncbi:MAG: hypothetical protein ACU0FH_01790 [Heliomarina sp.]|uniref:hypothetical protein n=1 Tax=Heliomarina sp. TaxID=2917556 RepID=UPI00405877A3
MYGIVLWSDRSERQAVIWCEDQGDLAYCRQTAEHGSGSIHAGDWVQFDITQNAQQRYAHNPRLVVEGGVNPLADCLARALNRANADKEPDDHGGAKIIEFAEMAELKA